MFRTGLIGGDEGQVDVGLHRARQLDFRLLRGFLQPLEGHAVLAEIDALVLAKLVRQVVHQALVEVLAAEKGVAVGRLHLEDALTDLEDGDVEGPAAEVEDRDLLVLLLLETVRQRGCGGLVDDAQHVQSGDPARILGRLALAVVEVRRHRDHGLGHLLAEVILGGLLHLLEDECRDFRRTVFLAADLHPRVAVVGLHDRVREHLGRLLHLRIVEAAADQALDREDRVLGIGDRLTAGDLPDQALSALREGYDRGRDATALSIRDHDGVAALDDGDARVRRPQIDSNHLGHRDGLLAGALTMALALGKVGIRLGLLRSGGLGDGHQGRAQQPLTQAIAGLVFLDHGVGLVLHGLDVRHRLVVSGIEARAPGLHAAHAMPLENLQ